MPQDLPTLPCPACEATRAGHNRGSCDTCNRYTQSVTRRLAKLIRTREPEVYARLRAVAERECWEDIVLPGGRKFGTGLVNHE